MKILAFSDLHSDTQTTADLVAASADADVLVAAGDFGTRGRDAIGVLEVLVSAEKPTILVAGNHDSLKELKQFCAGWDNGHLLSGNAIMIDGVTFFGLGGEIPRSNNETWNFWHSEEDSAEMLTACPEQTVLVTHAPPFGIGDLQRDGTHEGSKSILSAIEMKQPLLHLCGHIHFSWGASGQCGATGVHNLGPTANWFDV